MAVAIACFLIGTLLAPGWLGAILRLALAAGFTLFVWRAVFDETERKEVRKALGF